MDAVCVVGQTTLYLLLSPHTNTRAYHPLRHTVHPIRTSVAPSFGPSAGGNTSILHPLCISVESNPRQGGNILLRAMLRTKLLYVAVKISLKSPQKAPDLFRDQQTTHWKRGCVFSRIQPSKYTLFQSLKRTVSFPFGLFHWTFLPFCFV